MQTGRALPDLRSAMQFSGMVHVMWTSSLASSTTHLPGKLEKSPREDYSKANAVPAITGQFLAYKNSPQTRDLASLT